MKPINEIRIRLYSLLCLILLPLYKNYYPFGSGLIGIRNIIIICILGLVLGSHMTNLLIALKKWWKE